MKEKKWIQEEMNLDKLHLTSNKNLENEKR